VEAEGKVAESKYLRRVPVFLLAAFAKNEKADLTPTERAAMAKAVATMLANYRRKE
jgi:hypothetical protein